MSRRIYELSREVIEFQRATEPLGGVLGEAMRDEAIDVDPEVGGIYATSVTTSCRLPNGSPAFGSCCRAS